MAVMSTDSRQGAVFELPLVQQGWKQARRMLFQTQHGRPITSGYTSRPVADPFSQACSLFQVFAQYPNIAPSDVVSPTEFSRRAPSLLALGDVVYVVVYKQEYSVPYVLEPLPGDELADLQRLAEQVGSAVSEDDAAIVYRVNWDVPVETVVQLGSNWHPLELSAGKPFRWMNGPSADLCIFSPGPHNAALSFDMTSFAASRHLQMWVSGRMVYETSVPADGTLHSVQTPLLEWPEGPQLVRFVVPEGGASPSSLGMGNDDRQLSLGFGPISLAPPP
jgi:hypothetical protein